MKIFTNIRLLWLGLFFGGLCIATFFATNKIILGAIGGLIIFVVGAIYLWYHPEEDPDE